MPYNVLSTELRNQIWIMYLRKSRQDNPDESVEEVLAKHESILQEWAMRELGREIPEECIYREVVSGESIAERVRTLTSLLYDILRCHGIIRIDYIITEGNKLNLLEINTTPGMTATSFIPQQVRAAGLDIKEVLTEIIEESFED